MNCRWIAAIAAASALCLPAAALADATAASKPGWSGSGEFGLASASGNSKSLNVNARLSLAYENDTWKNTAFFDFNRAKSNVSSPVIEDGVQVGTVTNYETTANHYDLGGSIGYKFNPRAYLVGAARYDRDDFAPNRWQEVASVGFGYIVLRDARSQLSIEAGPGYKRFQPQTYSVIDASVIPPVTTVVTPPVQNEAIGRGLFDYKLAINNNVSLQDTFLAEVGSSNQYYQNDLGVAVAMTKTLALKVAYQNRYNSDTVPGTEHMDSLFTTNLVYNFGQSK